MTVDADAKLLLMDFCGEEPVVALCVGATIVAEQKLASRAAAAEWLHAVKALLQRCAWRPRDLSGIGVVSGPGSFTGVRVALAAAKGLCEATGLPFAAVSRLAVLAAADERGEAIALLDAGREEVYAGCWAEGGEWTERLIGKAQLEEFARDRSVVIAEAWLGESLQTLHPTLLAIGPAAIVPLILSRLRQGGDDLASTDANYVRSEGEIYRKAGGAALLNASRATKS